MVTEKLKRIGVKESDLKSLFYSKKVNEDGGFSIKVDDFMYKGWDNHKLEEEFPLDEDDFSGLNWDECFFADEIANALESYTGGERGFYTEGRLEYD